MALTEDQKKLDALYKKNFGDTRSASFGTKGGADYWLDTVKPTTQADWDEIDRMLAGSDEGVKYAASVAAGAPKVLPGGIDPTKSISSQSGPGTWASHFLDGGVFANENAAKAISDIAKDIGYTPSEAYFNTGVVNTTGPGGKTDPDGTTPAPTPDDGWWTQFSDADAFKKFLMGDQQKSDGMDDFMKFMMLMSVMKPGGGGGYGGSQYGYGGLNPGGVQSAYDPMASLTGMGDWFKKNFGSGSGTTTGTVNTGTTTGTT